jgi:hypothetical protein
MDPIDVIKNCVTTECGHFFHASCLMKNVAYNGFYCPYCRSTMAEKIESNDDNDYYDDDADYEEDDDDLYSGYDEDYSLLGFRLFMNNIEGIEHETQDINAEQLVNPNPLVTETIKPSLEFLTQKLIEQGITMEHLIKVILIDHEEYNSYEVEFSNIDNDINNKLRIIISNYKREQENLIQQENTLETNSNYLSEPNEYANITVRRPMLP